MSVRVTIEVHTPSADVRIEEFWPYTSASESDAHVAKSIETLIKKAKQRAMGSFAVEDEK